MAGMITESLCLKSFVKVNHDDRPCSNRVGTES